MKGKKPAKPNKNDELKRRMDAINAEKKTAREATIKDRAEKRRAVAAPGPAEADADPKEPVAGTDEAGAAPGTTAYHSIAATEAPAGDADTKEQEVTLLTEAQAPKEPKAATVVEVLAGQTWQRRDKRFPGKLVVLALGQGEQIGKALTKNLETDREAAIDLARFGVGYVLVPAGE